MAKFEKGEKVKWHYRSAIGHGEIESVRHPAEKDSDIEYNIKQFDHHHGEPEIVHHFGHALSKG